MYGIRAASIGKEVYILNSNCSSENNNLKDEYRVLSLSVEVAHPKGTFGHNGYRTWKIQKAFKNKSGNIATAFLSYAGR